MENQNNKKQNLKLPTISALFDKKNRLFLIGLLGILIIFLSDFLFKSQSGNESSENSTNYVQYQIQQNADVYVQNLEEELTQMIESIYGVGAVKVMITIETPGEIIYAQSEKSSTEMTTQNDGITDEKASFESEYTIIDDGNKDTPIIEMQTLPSIKGVAVVCEGGDDITVISNITELVSVVLGVSTNRICVTKMI